MVLDLREISTFTDFFVICSGTSEPHLKAIAGEIETRLREDHKTRPAAVDGFPTSQWIVLDYLQVIVHVFHREKRDFYSLEDLWSDAPRLTIPVSISETGSQESAVSFQTTRSRDGRCRIYGFFGRRPEPMLQVWAELLHPAGRLDGSSRRSQASASGWLPPGSIPSNSTSKISVASGPISAPAPRSP